jgi:hypothetical protein
MINEFLEFYGRINDEGVPRVWIRVITTLPNSEQSNKGKVKPHKNINRQDQSTTGKLRKWEDKCENGRINAKWDLRVFMGGYILNENLLFLLEDKW